MKTPFILGKTIEWVSYLGVMSLIFSCPFKGIWSQGFYFIFIAALAFFASWGIGSASKSWMVRERMWHWGKNHFDSFEDFWEWFEETDAEEIELCLADSSRVWGISLAKDEDNYV